MYATRGAWPRPTGGSRLDLERIPLATTAHSSAACSLACSLLTSSRCALQKPLHAASAEHASYSDCAPHLFSDCP